MSKPAPGVTWVGSRKKREPLAEQGAAAEGIEVDVQLAELAGVVEQVDDRLVATEPVGVANVERRADRAG